MNTHILELQGIQAKFNQKGAELISLTKNNREFIWQADPKFWNKHSPILFPIVGTLKNDSYQFEDKEYHLPRHGFAREMDFEVLQKTENSITFSLQHSAETLKFYPFKFLLELTYTLTERGISFNYKVENKGEETMYFSLGGHPAFNLKENFKDYSLLFENAEVLNCSPLVNNLISDKIETINLNENTLHLNYDLFENDALILKKIECKSVTILENGKSMLKVNYDDFSDLGIWTKFNAPFICIEPWLGYADTVDSSGKLKDKEGIRNLAPKSTFNAGFSIEIIV